MKDFVHVEKDEENQKPIPTAWRSTLVNIVEALKDGDYELKKGIKGVGRVSEKDALRIAGNIKSYGAQLTNLPEGTWDTSVCQWMRSYWDALIDLYTVEEGASDLALTVRVYETGTSYNFEVQSVHVP